MSNNLNFTTIISVVLIVLIWVFIGVSYVDKKLYRSDKNMALSNRKIEQEIYRLRVTVENIQNNQYRNSHLKRADSLANIFYTAESDVNSVKILSNTPNDLIHLQSPIVIHSPIFGIDYDNRTR